MSDNKKIAGRMRDQRCSNASEEVPCKPRAAMTADHQEVSVNSICLASQRTRRLSPRYCNTELPRAGSGNAALFDRSQLFRKKGLRLAQALLSELVGNSGVVEPHSEGNLVHMQQMEL
jgi:hypothetical protein